MTLLTVTTLILVLFTLAHSWVNPRNPCHEKRYLGENSNCETPVLPWKLCTECKLKETDPGGKFKDCKSIFDIQAPSCKYQLKKYAAMNPCDQLRGRQVADFDNNIESLDFFIYAICEECCDCVSVGAEVSDYYPLKRANELFDYETRANCATHVAVDVCKVFPKIKTAVKTVNDIPTPQQLANIPYICSPLQDWRNSRSSLPEDQRELVPEFAQGFLKNFSKAARCWKQSLWQDCVRLESDQNRI